VSARILPRLALLQMAGLYAFLFFSVGVPVALGYVVKRLLGRARPEFYDTLGSRSFFGPGADWNYESFPSTHAATAFGVAMMIGYLWPRWFGPAMVLALLVGISRVVLGAHYPTDVLGGFVFGVAGAALVRLVFVRLGWVFRRAEGKRIMMRRLSAVERLVRRPGTAQKAVPKQ
jgi:membrane-associated phospholipid phosphatase